VEELVVEDVIHLEEVVVDRQVEEVNYFSSNN
jgi:hypothetical protein